MGLPLYLAMTASEILHAQQLPEHCAYMACHFSPYGTGLSNFPEQLPESSMLILNDRTPAQGHDPQLIADQMGQLAEQFHVSAVLLDLQRPDNQETSAIVQTILNTLSCPVGVSEHYAKEHVCPVFLSPPPLHCLLSDHIAPWQNREIWLEAALEGETITVTESGSSYSPLPPAQDLLPCHIDTRLHCRYRMTVSESHTRFSILRTWDDLHQLLREAQNLFVTRAIGLYQELKTQ